MRAFSVHFDPFSTISAICCQDVNGEHVLGNFAEQSIKEIWHCDTLRGMKRLHKEGRFAGIPICRNYDM